MGLVYRALDQSLQRYVAVKLIRTGPQSLCDTPQLQRLFQEAIAEARVNHPHVVHIYFVGRDRDEPFLAMELVGGTTLTERIKQVPFSFASRNQLARQVTEACGVACNSTSCTVTSSQVTYC